MGNENVLYRLKVILDTYTEEELKEMALWVDADVEVEEIYIDKISINLITSNAEVKINNFINKEAKKDYKED